MELPNWVTVIGIVPPAEMLAYIRAADIAVTEGSNMTQEAAALGTPITMVPGTIYETWLLGTRLYEHEAAQIIWIEHVTPEVVADKFSAILANPSKRSEMTRRAQTLISGEGGGVEAAARLVLDLVATRQKPKTQFTIQGI